MYSSLLLLCSSCLIFVRCSPILVHEVAIPVEHEIVNPVETQEVVRVQRSPTPIFDIFGYGVKSHHHRPHYGHGGYGGYGNHGHHGGGDYYGNGGGFAGSSAQAGSFAGNIRPGYGGPGGYSQSQASSNSASFAAGPFSASFSASQANSGSNSIGGFGGYYRRK